VSGRFVKKIYEGVKDRGYHTIRLDTKDNMGRKLSQGVYFLRMEAGEFKENRKIVLLR